VSSFRDAVASVQPVFAGAANEAYMTHADRLGEADHVEPIVSRAVFGELDPTGHHAVGRVTRFSPPGLAEYLSSKGRYNPGDEPAEAAIADATSSVMALGWLFMCTPDAPAAERTARDIWDFWAGVSLRDALDQVVEKNLARLIHRNGADMLATKLKDAGLKPRLGAQVSQIGFQIVQHGCYLRMVQTVEIDEQAFRKAIEFRRDTGIGSADGRWDWDAYPVGDSSA
jgi:hypothetical protein